MTLKDKGEVNQQRPADMHGKTQRKWCRWQSWGTESARPRGHSVAESYEEGGVSKWRSGPKGWRLTGNQWWRVGAGGRNGKMGAQISPLWREVKRREALAGRGSASSPFHCYFNPCVPSSSAVQTNSEKDESCPLMLQDEKGTCHSARWVRGDGWFSCMRPPCFRVLAKTKV